MKTDDLEDELRNLKLTHLTETELITYCEQEPDPLQRARVEAHVKQCFRCERQLELLREESAALGDRRTTPEDVEFVERLIAQTRPVGIAGEPSLEERLAEYLRQMVASWRAYFLQGATRGELDQGEEVWQWQSEGGRLKARTVMEENADLTIHFSSTEVELEGARLNVRLGQFNQEITLRRISESAVHAKVAVPWEYRRGKVADLSIESAWDRPQKV